MVVNINLPGEIQDIRIIIDNILYIFRNKQTQAKGTTTVQTHCPYPTN